MSATTIRLEFAVRLGWRAGLKATGLRAEPPDRLSEFLILHASLIHS
jgi:hypothetical protein